LDVSMMKFSAYISAALIACSPLAFLRPVQVRGESMEPTLHNGQLAFALWPWCSGSPSLGQVWVLESPDGAAIKRVLALPGSMLEQCDGHLALDGNGLEEPYVAFRDTGNNGRWLAESGYLFLGDNRPASRDSRAWGHIEKRALRGRVVGRSAMLNSSQ